MLRGLSRLLLLVGGLTGGLLAIWGPVVASGAPGDHPAEPPRQSAVARGRTAAAAQLAVAPSARSVASMAYDAANGTIVLFGGDGPYGSLNDTWIWTGGHWREAHPTTAPPARSGAVMSYDPTSRQVLMLGGTAEVPLTDPCTRSPGRTPSCTPPSSFRTVYFANDLWAWNGSEWHVALPASQQPAGQAMASDPLRRVAMLVGGPSGQPVTWVKNAGGWTKRSSSGLPGGFVKLAFDADLRAVIAIDNYQPGLCMPHSGCTQSSRVRMARWTGDHWQTLTDFEAAREGRGPLGDLSALPSSLTADPLSGGLLVVAADGGTWRMGRTRWSRVDPADRSHPSSQAQLVADVARKQVIAFGGNTGPLLSSPPRTNITWIWNGATWRHVTAPVLPTPTPPAPAVQPCVLNGPALIPTQQTTASGLQIAVSGLFGLLPCHLLLSLRLTLVDADRNPLPVSGNGVSASLDIDVPSSGPAANVLSASWSWADPCSPDGVAVAEIQAVGQGALSDPVTLALHPAACAPAPDSALSTGSIAIGQTPDP